jgi:hypothetical protein
VVRDPSKDRTAKDLYTKSEILSVTVQNRYRILLRTIVDILGLVFGKNRDGFSKTIHST